jgi:NADP-reducing hydrogenase subunit HndD
MEERAKTGLLKIEINGKPHETSHEYLLPALEEAGFVIPKLCSHPDFLPFANCRLCVVEVNGKIKTSCNTEITEGMAVRTDTEQVIEARRHNMELILSNHPLDCDYCYKNMRCELQTLAEKITKNTRYSGEQRKIAKDESSSAVTRDTEKCILCGRCIAACGRAGVCLLDYTKRGFNTQIAPPLGLKLADTSCTGCGQCALVCPTAAIIERDDRSDVYAMINDNDKFVIAQIAPSLRASIGEEFGLKPGSISTGRLIASLKGVGFDAVCDTSVGADFTIMEEATELLSRMKERDDGKSPALPMFTSCCPSWVSLVEEFYPELIPNLSTTKSPHEILGVLLKTYYAEKKGIPSDRIAVVSIMPCTSKKSEAKKVEHKIMGVPAVDAVLTVRETARMIREAGIDLKKIKEEEFDSLLQNASGAGQIFGTTGGVMEAALRTADFLLSGKNNECCLEFRETRGMSGIKEAEYSLGEKKIRVAVANSNSNAKILLEKIRGGEESFDFVEVMACPGGCSGGGGQPIPGNRKIVEERMKALYEVDRATPIRRCHDNPTVKSVYSDFLEKPCSDVAEKMLHTSYSKKKKFIIK